jgi:DNA-binding transcriptional LysR family regulator
MDIDLRKLRYFVAVAEELHFGRAADRLHIAQPVLSRQIRAFEDELGVPLFRRDRRGTALTRAGRQLLDDGRPLLVSALALRRRVAGAAARGPMFTIGFMPGITVTSAVRAMQARHPDLEVRLLRTDWFNQVDVLHDGRVDVSLVRLPVDVRGLQTRRLFEEPRVALLPSGHRLAGKETVMIADLAEDHLLQDPDAVPEWRDVAVEVRERNRRPVPKIRSVEEKLELVAGEAGIAVIPLSTARFYTRPDVVTVPVDDLSPNVVSLAWLAGRGSCLIDDFSDIVANALLAEQESN